MLIYLTRMMLALGLMGAIAFSSSANQVAGAAKDKKKNSYYKGKIISYDAELKLMRVAKGRESVTLVVEPEIPMQIDSKATTKKVAELPAETNVVLLLNADKSGGVELNAIGPMVSRTIDSIDLENLTLRCHDNKKSPETITFAKDVPVTNDQVRGTLEDMKVGSRVFLNLSFDKSKALAIRVIKSKK